MKILIATDSFKGSLTSIQAGEAIAKGIAQSGIDAQIDLCPLADGGEGTVDAFAVATNATCWLWSTGFCPSSLPALLG